MLIGLINLIWDFVYCKLIVLGLVVIGLYCLL